MRGRRGGVVGIGTGVLANGQGLCFRAGAAGPLFPQWRENPVGGWVGDPPALSTWEGMSLTRTELGIAPI